LAAIARRRLLCCENEMRQPAYIMASERNGTLYVGVTCNLPQRVFHHREGLTRGFTTQYGCKTLVYCEMYEDMESAIAREKALKGGSRRKKLLMIERFNPQWRDLYIDFA
jgi:predicted GIY-YIG superfamily endonuclease